ncbi:hypothetical protein [Caldovatus aquaticus]|uniref:Uncharacterized protein n=1 Tax=Caldovatus aquaticus TaxID=2865671 RepID=A0ABS7F6U7_9PROT|nr:hypothetical protein [Caldovatus aquaticus]MBW8271048.1 hypothetical protein [Caldovatus aquaticus]
MNRDEGYGQDVTAGAPAGGTSHAPPGPDEAIARQGEARRKAAPATGGAAKPRRPGAGARTAWAHPRPRAAAPLPPPTEAEVRRMVAEFQARGGQITVCRPVHLLPVQNGAGSDAKRWTA